MIEVKTFNNQIKFRYVNWHGVEHVYVAQPQSVELGPYTENGIDKSGPNQWVLNAYVVNRDGEDRPGRRTFLLSKIEEIKE